MSNKDVAGLGQHESARDVELMQSLNTGSFERNSLLEYLRTCLDDVCCRIATKFNLFDGAGRMRKTFILDSLFRFCCTGCLLKVFTQMRKLDNDPVDVLYKEMHGLAVNIFSGALVQALGDEGFSVCYENDIGYGRADVIVKPTIFGAVIEGNELRVIVEVKTGRGLSFAQFFRYLMQYPNAVLVIWRATMRQVFVLSGKKLQTLLCMYILSAMSRALKLLNDKAENCKHNPNLNKSIVISDPQKLLDDFFQGLVESLPKAVAAVVEALKEGGVCGV